MSDSLHIYPKVSYVIAIIQEETTQYKILIVVPKSTKLDLL